MIRNFEDCIKLFSDDKVEMGKRERTAIIGGCAKVLNTISDPVIVLNTDFETMFANKGFLRCINKDMNSVIGKKCFDVFDCCGVKEQNGACPFSDCIKMKQSKTIEFFQKNSGKYWEMIVDPCMYDKKVVACIHFFKDITQRKLKDKKIIYELNDLSNDMEKMNDLMVSREVKMAELKDQVDVLETEKKYLKR